MKKYANGMSWEDLVKMDAHPYFFQAHQSNDFSTGLLCVEKKMRTGFVWSELYAFHNNEPAMGSTYAQVNEAKGLYLPVTRHFENPETKRRLFSLLDACGLLERLERIKPRKATEEELRLFHTEEYIAKVKKLSEKQGGEVGDEAIVGRGSYEIARLAVGGCIRAVEEVWNGAVKNAYVLVRPPGHHAERDRGSGFCIFSNVALAALYAQEKLGVGKIAIVDWDVHHGNGTQQAFYDTKRVLFISVHQDGLYPLKTGRATEIGCEEGMGYTLNIPLPPGSGCGAYEAVFDRVIVPALNAYGPQMILVSCGFDAAAFDPLSHQMLHSEAYRMMTRKVMGIESARGRVVCVHEGGYSPEMVPYCGLAVIEELSGIKTNVKDVFLDEIKQFRYQQLQPHQDEIIKNAERHVQTFLKK